MARVKPLKATPRPCPVCNMEKISSDLWRCYRGVKFNFCSQQCLDRFVAYPGLYCGNPKTGKSEKQKGRTELECHKIVFTKKIPDDQYKGVETQLKSMMGVVSIQQGDNHIIVTYDLLEVSLASIEDVVQRVLSDFNTTLLNTLHRTWVRYTEECELENMSNPGKSSGCH
ncbi:hypothetical protein [Teredinibacter turnerae]|uniref:hypothetical protein n=1 Tax=Teredinibacter turnerae TaxID=2426 RepID=UPI001E466D77|nr:hypothetical protein [Teredinibacter turnerae]